MTEPGIPQPRGAALVAIALRRPVSVVMAVLALLVVGAIANRNIPVELIPSGFTPPFLYVEVPTLRASPSDVERRIAAPVEDMLATVRNVRSLATRVSPNRASFFIEFADRTDMDVAYNQVRDRIDRVLPTLDDPIGRYVVWKYNPSDEPILWFAVTFPETSGADWTIDNIVAASLERVPGVSRVEAYGVPERVVAVRVHQRGVDATGLGVEGVVARLGDDNLALAAGTLDADGGRLPLRVTARFTSIDDLLRTALPGGVTLADVADVAVEDRAERAVYRVNREPSVFLAVYKESTANSVDVSRRVHEVIDGSLRGDSRLDGFDFAYFFDQGEVIAGAIGNLKTTTLQGAAFAVVILLYFLRRVGMTLLVTLAIPASLLLTVAVMYFVGRSLNVLSLTGLMLAVGMVVDNAIVVVESIQAQLQRGLSRREAAYAGTAEVGLAIVVSTATTVVVFLPMILMTGNEMVSFYLSQIGFPVCVGLIASLLVSLICVPVAAAANLGMSAPARVATVERMQRGYARALGWALGRRADAALLAVLVVASLAWVMPRVPRTDKQEPNINDLRVFVDFAPELGWDDRVQAMLRLEDAVWVARDELEIANLLVRLGGPWGRPQLRAFLRPPEERTLEREDVIERVTARLPSIAGVSWSLDWSDEGGAANALVVRIGGRDSAVLAELADEASRRLRHVDGVSSVRTEEGDDAATELQLSVERERALRLGLSSLLVGASVDFALRGRRVDSLHEDGRRLPIVVEGDVDASEGVAGLLRMRLSPSDSALADVTTAHEAAGYGSIDREKGRTIVSLTLRSGRDDVERLGEEVQAALSGMSWPRGYGPELRGRFDGLDQDRREQNFAVLLAVVCVFLLMGVLFESVVLPFSIILSIPFAFVGVYWALFVTRTSFDMMAGVGVIILVGVVVNNAIVLVDRIEELRRLGSTRDAAVVDAAEQRLRPILMTAATTIAGLVPMAAGTTALVGIPYSPLGRAVIGGMVASTLLTMFIVPLFYAALDDLSAWSKRWARGLSHPTSR